MRHFEKSFQVGASEALEIDLANSLISSDNSPAVTACETPPPVTITLVVAAQGEGRTRAFLRGGHIRHYTPGLTRSYQGMIRTSAMDAMGELPSFEQPILFVLRSVSSVPATLSAKPCVLAIADQIKPGNKPDIGNIAMPSRDELDGVIFLDDALMTRAVLEKAYGDHDNWWWLW